MNNLKRDSFVFYRSYYEAIATLSAKNQLIAYDAIMQYSLNREIVEDLPTRVLAIFRMAIPQIDANYRKYCNSVKAKSSMDGGNVYDKNDAGLDGGIALPMKKFEPVTEYHVADDFKKAMKDEIGFD